MSAGVATPGTSACDPALPPHTNAHVRTRTHTYLAIEVGLLACDVVVTNTIVFFNNDTVPSLQ